MNVLKKLILGAISIGFLTIPAFAKQMVDLDKSKLSWKASKKLGKEHNGTIKIKSAQVDMDGDKINSAEFLIDMDSIDVLDLSGNWKNKFLGHIKSEDFFDVKKHPTAKLMIENQVNSSVVEGKLTIKGKTQPVKVAFRKDGNKYTGTLLFDRTKFDVIYGSGNIFKKLVADNIINDDVSLDFDVYVKK